MSTCILFRFVVNVHSPFHTINTTWLPSSFVAISFFSRAIAPHSQFSIRAFSLGYQNTEFLFFYARNANILYVWFIYRIVPTAYGSAGIRTIGVCHCHHIVDSSIFMNDFSSLFVACGKRAVCVRGETFKLRLNHGKQQFYFPKFNLHTMNGCFSLLRITVRSSEKRKKYFANQSINRCRSLFSSRKNFEISRLHRKGRVALAFWHRCKTCCSENEWKFASLWQLNSFKRFVARESDCEREHSSVNYSSDANGKDEMTMVRIEWTTKQRRHCHILQAIRSGNFTVRNVESVFCVNDRTHDGY